MNVDVLYKIDNIYFSDKNATDRYAKIFNDFNNFKNLNFDSFNINKIPKYGTDIYKNIQAEILIPDSLDISNLVLEDLIIQKRLYLFNFGVLSNG
ncbi:putative DUF4433 domain protein [Campylobacter iguaniorum]|nr:putative DUF4433 domain protein [Campylobacter iguaniorum]